MPRDVRSDDTYEARVITLPVERATTAARQTAATAAARQVAAVGAWSVDDWGRDPYLVDATIRLGALRWRTVVGGAERLPGTRRCADRRERAALRARLRSSRRLR